MDLKNLITQAASLVPQQKYVVGEKSKSSGIPLNVQVSIDKDFKNTLIKGIAILSLGVAAGTAAGIIISSNKK